MSKYTQYTINDSDPLSIALQQTGPGINRSFLLNGRLGKNPLNSNGFSNLVSITLSVATANIKFTIKGLQNNTLFTDMITSTGNNAVLISNQSFDSVVSITSDTDISSLTVNAGTVAGDTGKSTYSVPIAPGTSALRTVNCLFNVVESTTPAGGSYNCQYTIYGALAPILGINKTVSMMINNELLPIGTCDIDKPTYNLTQPYQYCVLGVSTTQSPYMYPGTIFRTYPTN